METNTKAALILAGGLVAAALINRGIYAPLSIRGIGPVLNFNRFTGKVGPAVPRPAVSALVTSHKPDPTAGPTARLLRPKALTRPLTASDFEPVEPDDILPIAPLGYTVIHSKGLVAVNPKTGRCITWIDGKWVSAPKALCDQR